MIIHSVYAADGVNFANPTIWPLAGAFPNLSSIPSRILPMALTLGGVIFFIMVIMSGFAILSGAGSDDAQKMAKWHQILSSGLIGLIIMFVAFWVVQIINYITGGSLSSIL